MLHGYDLDKLYDKLNLTGKVVPEDGRLLGAGGCANVYVGNYDGRRVAVKVIRELGMSSNELTLKRRLIREVRAWVDLHHRNVLPLLGFVYAFDVGSKLASLVSPWMPHGTARRYLETRSSGEKIRILTNVADGLCYLHRYDVVHGDIKGDNILIDETFEPRLSDFGLSKVISETKAIGDTVTHTQGFFGSIRWTARELFSTPEEFGTPGLTKESDIWAFAMTIIELYTSLVPYSKIRTDPQVIIAIHNGQLPEQPDEYCGFDDDMWALCTSCWAVNPALRPTTKSLAKRLWELEVKFKLGKAQEKKRKSREPDSPDTEHGKATSIEERLRKSPKLSALAELDSNPSPGTPRSLSSPSLDVVRTPSSGAISRTSSFSSTASSSSSSTSNDPYGIDPRKLFTGQSHSEWAVHPAWRETSRYRQDRKQTEPSFPQRYNHGYPCHPNDIMRNSRRVDSLPPVKSSFSMPELPTRSNHSDFHPVHSSYSCQETAGLQLDGLSYNESEITPYVNYPDFIPFQPMHSSYEYMDPSQWVSFPEQPATSRTPADSFDSQLSPSAMNTPLASHVYPSSPSPSPFLPHEPIFSEVFTMGLREDPSLLANFNSPSAYGDPYANPVDFVTMPHGVLSPALSDLESPYIPFTEEPCHVPNTDTPVIGTYDSFDDFDELESDFALFGGVNVDENVLRAPRFEIKSSASTTSSRQGSGSTVTGASSCSSQTSRQASGSSDCRPLTPQLSPLLSSF